MISCMFGACTERELRTAGTLFARSADGSRLVVRAVERVELDFADDDAPELPPSAPLSAEAISAELKSTAPTPSATASPPTRPMNCAAAIASPTCAPYAIRCVSAFITRVSRCYGEFADVRYSSSISPAGYCLEADTTVVITAGARPSCRVRARAIAWLANAHA